MSQPHRAVNITPDARVAARATLDAFFVEHGDSDAVWVAAAFLDSNLLVNGKGTVPGYTRRARHIGDRAASVARICVHHGDLDLDRCFRRVGDNLFAAATENHGRVLTPIMAAGAQEYGQDQSVTVRVGRMPNGRELTRAGKLANDLIFRLHRSGIPFPGGGASIYKAFLGAIRSSVYARAVVAQTEPSIVIASTNHGLAAPPLIGAASREGVPSLYVPHAPMLRDQRLHDLPFDFAALRGDREAAWYTDRGVSPSRLSVIGNPGLSPAPEMVDIPIEASVVLALSPYEDELIRRLALATEAAAGDRVVVAPHPRQDHRGLNAAIPKSWETWTGRTYDLLRTGPCALVQYSSGVCLEAMLLGIPSIELNLLGEESTYPFLQTDLVRLVSSPEELPAALTYAHEVGRDEGYRRELISWARSWCSATGTDSAQKGWEAIRTAASYGACSSLIWDTWSSDLITDVPLRDSRGSGI